MKIKKQPSASAPQAWSVAELGAFYTEHNFELKAHANRILKDSTRADEVVQDAFIKVMLAAPELTSADHALSYLHRTIENLCIDLFRAEGRRPNLVVLDDAQAEIESQWQDAGDHSQNITAAEDAAIIRQALALLSPAERTALVMWEMDGRSTAEIAAELGIKESSVRHTVSRARASLRKVLTTLVIDQERGLTALDLLSTSYKKASDLAKKSGKAAMSFILIITAFFGFNSLSNSASVQNSIKSPVSDAAQESTIAQSPVESAPVTAPAAAPVVKRPNTQELVNNLNFAEAQLESAAVMLQTLQLIEERSGSK